MLFQSSSLLFPLLKVIPIILIFPWSIMQSRFEPLAVITTLAFEIKNNALNCSCVLQVNEYPCGVGLSPHIDTHSAFEEMIFSLSLAGPCIMEFRKYTKGSWCTPSVVNGVDEDSSQEPECIRKAIFLPPRSMLLMSGEGRYAWHHYIPHHKVCILQLYALLCFVLYYSQCTNSTRK